MTGEAVIFSGITKSYPGRQVLSGIDLTVNQGEFLGLIGVNGAGKTTLIKCMLDFTCVNSGSISIFEQNHLETKARERLAYLPEKFIPPYYLTGKDFLQYMSGLYHTLYDHEKVMQILSILDLDHSALFQPVRQLSKGMAQKLGLAACFLSNKDLLILDEPMSGLDPKARAYLKRYLLELKERGKTLFFSTHMLADVQTLCNRVAILHGGRIKFAGSPSDCCTRYAADNIEQAYLNCVEAEGCSEAVPVS